MLVALPTSEQPTPATLDRLAREYSFKDELDSAWAVRPLELARDRGQTILVLEDPGGDLLSSLLGAPFEVGRFLRLAVGVVAALGKAHLCGLIHKDIKPANILVDRASGEEVRLTGFGIASRLVRERQPPGPPEAIAGTLAYMAPEQTGRMNRSVDSRSDLYSLGVTLYQMLTGSLPFTVSDPMEWVHCHIARRADAPGERASGIPEALSSIVMKLLAKTAEERYQTAAGVEIDLRRCLSEWQAGGRIDPFTFGAEDFSDRLLIPEKLYGREQEVATLLAAFDRVVTQGAAEIVLISGYSGVGKSSVVNELHKVLVPPRGLFAAGKFDQYKRDVPYATLVQAFHTLVRQILVKSQAEVDDWRSALLDALGTQGQLMVNLIPELEFVIGKQPSVADLPPQEARNRFQSVFKRFLGAFAAAEHPLALFLDDLHWLDMATLELLERLILDPDVRHVLIIGAYRDNEVSSSHSLMRTLATIREDGAKMMDIVLQPLAPDDVGRLIADALRRGQNSVGSLTQLICEKTGGNPFFVIQFLTALAEERLLRFDREAACWAWDLDQIRAKRYSDSVVDLMVGKLQRLSERTQAALQRLACLGNMTGIATLRLVFGPSEEDLIASLLEAVRAGLILRLERSYAFLHDRIQEAAYALIPESERAQAHLRIGRALFAGVTADGPGEHLFDVANQLNRGAVLLIGAEKIKAAAIDLRAGRRAKASAAYASARTYFAAGMALLCEGDWSSSYELTFGLWLECAECEFLTGRLDRADQLVGELLQRAASKVDEAAVYHLKVRLHVMKSEIQHAVEASLACLRAIGIEIPARPTQEDVEAENETVWRTLDGRTIESLIDLPLMTDPELQAAMKVLSVLLVPAMLTDFRLCCFLAARMATLSVQYGTSGDSAFAFAYWGSLLGHVSHRYGEGYRFAKLAADLVEKHGFTAGGGRVYIRLAGTAAWTQPITTAIDFSQTGIRTAVEAGDPLMACIGMQQSIAYFLLRNDPLERVWRRTEVALDFDRTARFDDAADIVVIQQRFIAVMQGLTTTFSTFSDAEFDEGKFEARFTMGQSPLILCWWIFKLKARFLAGNFAEALAAAEKAKPLVEAAANQIQLLDYFFYTALTVAALYEAATADERQAWRKLLAEHRKQLREWAENCPPTFADKHSLVLAETARIEGRDADALRLYEDAIESAREQGFVQTEGLSHELAGRYCLARGLKTAGYAHLGNARNCYDRWGAHGKVRQLDQRYPHLAGSGARHSTAAVGSAIQHLDVVSFIKASQALSGEILLPKLIEELMTIALENAGADRGLLILPAGDEHLIQAEARATGDHVEVTMRQQPITGITSPESIVRYVIRTHESVILDDASKPNLFSADAYLRDRQSKSILCLPLIKQQQLAGILLLENALTSYVFTPARIAVLELLAAQAAISLENTRLYGDLQQREAKIRRLVDANIIGIYVIELGGRIIEANDAFLRMVGYEREDLVSGSLHWTDLTPGEWRAGDAERVEKLKLSGTLQPFEKEYFHKGGGRVPVLVGVARFEETGSQAVAFVIDLTERKRAESEAHESERRFREAQLHLAHANRVATMGQLAASIAHEVNQPIAALLMNAETAVRWLARQPPNVEKAKSLIDRTISDGRRTADIVSRIRDFSKNAATRKDSLEINQTILEIMILARAPVSRHRVLVRTQLSEGLPHLFGDKVQLQQVILNLIMNAIEAMSEVSEGPRELSISTTKAEPDGVLVAVGDSGPGLSPESLARIFEPFYTTKPSGLGMGLSICRSIVEAHGGRLWTMPNEPHGAIFCMMLPIQEKTLERLQSPGA